jgi:hypothetical protein
MFKVLIILPILIISTVLAAPINLEEYEADNKKLAGTPSREEYEFKFAFNPKGDISSEGIAHIITKAFDEIQKNKKFKFNALIEKEYFLDNRFLRFSFVDYYYDTKDLSILKANSALRHRYRWKSYQRYYFYQYFPFLSLFYPIRTEFQFKENYRFESDTQRVRVDESRFEFRDESSPFLGNTKAPSAPWWESEYKEYLKAGTYLKYKILPVYNAIQLIKKNQTDLKYIEFKKVLKIVTKRFRSHINIMHPWGVGPNPNQTFILTVDHSQSGEDTFFEIEIEIDRNTSTSINDLSNIKAKDSVEGLSRHYSEQARLALRNDLKLLQDEIVLRLKKLDLKALPEGYKYKRFMELKKQ